jgi:hypothetical protein
VVKNENKDKKTLNPSLHPIAARWAAPGELFVSRKKGGTK